MCKRLTLFLAILSLFTVSITVPPTASLMAQAKKDKKKASKRQSSKRQRIQKPDGLAITGLPLFAFNDDLGLTYGARVIGSYYQKDYAPYRYQFWAQFLNSSLGYVDHAVRMDYVSKNGLRWIARAGFQRELFANYYGYGNNQDVRRIRRVTGDREPVVPIGANLVRKNFSNEQLKESQNRYYNYDYQAPYITTSLEDWIFNSNFKWYIGFQGKRYIVRSYFGDIEASEKEPNILTYIDIEQPVGYETVRDDVERSVNYARFALAYDSRPRKRENNPNAGIFTDIHLENSGEVIGSDYAFSNLSITWRQYVSILPSLWAKIDMESIFAYRFMIRETLNGTAPFFEAGKLRNIREEVNGLGGQNGLRGYPSNQFIDKFITLANFELRHTFLRTALLGGMDFQLFSFYDIGRVAPSSSQWQPKEFHKAGGGGFSTIWQDNTIVLFFLGYSKEHSFTAFKLSHTF